MSISVLGQQLTTEVGDVGSFAAAKVANYVREDYLKADLLAVQEGFDKYLRQDFELNYGDPKIGYPIFRYKTKQEDKETNSRIISELLAVRRSKDDLPLKKSEVYEKLGFTQPKEEDETI